MNMTLSFIFNSHSGRAEFEISEQENSTLSIFNQKGLPARSSVLSIILRNSSQWWMTAP